jgi:hypothetical protein
VSDDFKTYRAVNSLSIPLYDQDGKPRVDGKETLVQGGSNVDLPTELAQRALDSGSVRELTDQERDELNPPQTQEGAEVNGTPEAGPGAPTPEPAAETDQDGRLQRPANGATKEKWVAFAEQEGLDSSGTRDEIRARYEQAEKLEAQ